MQTQASYIYTKQVCLCYNISKCRKSIKGYSAGVKLLEAQNKGLHQIPPVYWHCAAALQQQLLPLFPLMNTAAG